MARRTAARKRCPDFANILRQSAPTTSVREQIAECFYTEMTRFARLRCRDTTLAQDAVQDAMINGLDALGSFRGEAPLQYWLRRLVLSACSRLRRSRKNDPRLHVTLDEVGDDEGARTQPDTQEAQVFLSQRLEILREVLREIEEPNRSLLLLHEGQEESLAELAVQFDLSVEAVKARLKRTRARLRRRLLEKADEPA